MAQPLSSWDRFEISILRLCRGQYLAMAVLGATAVLVGGGALLVAFVIGTPARHRLPPEVAPRPPLTSTDVEKLRSSQPGLFDLAKASSMALATDPQKADVEIAKRFRDLFPDPPYNWDDLTQEYCRSPSAYGCLEKGRKIAKPGTGRLIAVLISELSREDAIALLDGIRPVLSAAKVEQRAELIVPSSAAYVIAIKEHQKAIDERAAKVEDINEKFDKETKDRRDFKELLVAGGLYGVLSGLSAMLLSGLFLAFLAMERHLRDIRERQSRS